MFYFMSVFFLGSVHDMNVKKCDNMTCMDMNYNTKQEAVELTTPL